MWRGCSGVAANLAELALVNQVHQLTHQVDDVTTDQLISLFCRQCYNMRHLLDDFQTLWFGLLGVDMHSFLCVANLGELRSTLGIHNVNPNKATDLIVPFSRD